MTVFIIRAAIIAMAFVAVWSAFGVLTYMRQRLQDRELDELWRRR